MTGELVLITGATGHLGFRTLVEALLAGYRVRAAVRNEAGIAKVKGAKSVQPYLDQLEFILVPDIEQETAYNEAVKDVTYIIHLASPITDAAANESPEKYDELLIQPAINGTLNMLRAARDFSPTTKRIVITASIIAIMSFPDFFSDNTGRVFNEKSRTPVTSGPYTNVYQGYAVSKVAALKASEDFFANEKPHFEVNYISPSFTIGKNELATTPEAVLAGTNAAAFAPVLGKDAGATPSTSVHVNDIAKMHVLALSPSIPSGQNFIGLSENSHTEWEDSFEIVKKHFPAAVANGTFPLTGKNHTKKLIIDNSYTKKTLGLEFLSYEEQVKSVGEHYLELKSAA